MPATVSVAALQRAAAFLVSPAALAYTVAAGGLSLFFAVLLHVILGRSTGAGAEMSAPGGPFRPLRSAAMLYPPLLAPAVQAALSLALALACFGEPAVRAWGVAEACRFTALAWACTSAHGILLDLCVFKMTWRVAVQWWAGSLAAALAAGVCMAEML